MLWTILIILIIIAVVFFVLNRTRGGGRGVWLASDAGAAHGSSVYSGRGSRGRGERPEPARRGKAVGLDTERDVRPGGEVGEGNDCGELDESSVAELIAQRGHHVVGHRGFGHGHRL